MSPLLRPSNLLRCLRTHDREFCRRNIPKTSRFHARPRRKKPRGDLVRSRESSINHSARRRKQPYFNWSCEAASAETKVTSESAGWDNEENEAEGKSMSRGNPLRWGINNLHGCAAADQAALQLLLRRQYFNGNTQPFRGRFPFCKHRHLQRRMIRQERVQFDGTSNFWVGD